MEFPTACGWIEAMEYLTCSVVAFIVKGAAGCVKPVLASLILWDDQIPSNVIGFTFSS